MNKNEFFLKTIMFLAMSFPVFCGASQEKLNEETERYYNILKVENYETTLRDIKASFSDLQWSGIGDERIFDAANSRITDGIIDGTVNVDSGLGGLIASTLIAISAGELFYGTGNYYVVHAGGSDEDRIQEISYLLKLLGVSGNEKYRVTLETIAKSSMGRVRKYANESLDSLDKYSIYAPVIRQDLDRDDVEDLNLKRVTNMLCSGHVELARAGSKIAYRSYPKNSEVLDCAAKGVRELATQTESEYYIDGIRWLIKLIGNSGNPEYLPALEYVISNSNEKSITSDAKKFASKLKKS